LPSDCPTDLFLARMISEPTLTFYDWKSFTLKPMFETMQSVALDIKYESLLLSLSTRRRVLGVLKFIRFLLYLIGSNL